MPPKGGGPSGTNASALIGDIKLNIATLKLILLTAGVVIALLSTPLFFVLRNFVTFDALDRYFNLTEKVRPGILRSIAERLDSGYSKNFFLTRNSSDNTMLFYASAGESVSLTVNIAPIGSAPPVTLLVNNCPVILQRSGQVHLYDKDLTQLLDKCGPDEPSLNTLRISVSSEEMKTSAVNINCLVLVSQKIHDHFPENPKK